MVDLNDLKASSEQNWEPEGTPKVAQGASRLNPKLSVSRVVGGLTAVPGPVEGKGEVNSPEMQVGTVLVSGTPCIRWIRRMTESVLLARLEFKSEAKPEGGVGGGTGP